MQGSGDHSSDVAVLLDRSARMEKDFAEFKALMSERYDALAADVTGIKRQADRWKGGFIVIVSLGSVIGWLISTGSNLAAFFGKH